MNAWTVGIIRYGAGVLDWMKEELKTIIIKTRKLMTINGGLQRMDVKICSWRKKVVKSGKSGYI